MTPTVRAAYTKARINDLVFSDEVTGSVQPGFLDHLINLRTIRRGTNMTELIEPGTIPKHCTALLLPASYKHKFSASEFHHGLWVYIHVSNLKYAPASSRPFNIWSETRAKCIPGCQWDYELPRKSSYYEDVYFCEAVLVTELRSRRIPDFRGSYNRPLEIACISKPKSRYPCYGADDELFVLSSPNEPAEPYEPDVDHDHGYELEECESCESDEYSEPEEYDGYDEMYESGEDNEYEESNIANRLRKFKVSCNKLARMVRKSRIDSTRMAEEKAIEIAESIHSRLMKAADEAKVHLGFKLRFRARSDHVTDIIELLTQTFPFVVIDQHKRSLIVCLPAAE